VDSEVLCDLYETIDKQLGKTFLHDKKLDRFKKALEFFGTIDIRGKRRNMVRHLINLHGFINFITISVKVKVEHPKVLINSSKQLSVKFYQNMFIRR